MMQPSCFYYGRTPMDNNRCNLCSLFLTTCIPVADIYGFALSSECDFYFCESCNVNCDFKNFVNI